MKRLHVHMAVDDLDRAIAFYATLFGVPPTVRRPDYVKWMLEDPPVNFAVSQRDNHQAGIDHLGIQVESDSELREISGRLRLAGERTREQEATTCCYAQSNKAWVNDPAGTRWETFFTFGEAAVYGDDEPAVLAADAPKSEAAQACCSKTPAS